MKTKRNFGLTLAFVALNFVAQAAFADVTTFRGEIDLGSWKSVNEFSGEPEISSTQDKFVVNIILTSTLPSNGIVKNESRVYTDPDQQSRQVVICEFRYTFPAATAIVNLTRPDGTAVGYSTADAALTGIVYTDSPSTLDASLCKAPDSSKFPITGHMDVAISPFKDFALPNGLMLSLETALDPLSNEAVIDLANKDGSKPVLKNLTFSGAKTLRWRTFGTKDPNMSGNVELKLIK